MSTVEMHCNRARHRKLRRSGYHHRRSASPRLPSVKARRESSTPDAGSAVGSLLASSLSSLTLGSLGLGNTGTEKDPVRQYCEI